MQIAVCHYSYHRTYAARQWTPLDLAAHVAELGVPGIDFHVRFLGTPATAASSVKEALQTHNLELAGLSMSNNFSQPTTEALREQVQQVKRWLEVAAEVGAPVSRIFGGHLPAEEREDSQTRDTAMQRILDGLAAVVTDAERLGVVLALENHGGLPMYGREQADMIERINSPSLRATIDIGNYMIGGQEGHHGTQEAAARAAYVHVKDFKVLSRSETGQPPELQPCTVGQGDVDVHRCLSVMRDHGYNGWVGLEYEGVDDELTGVPESVAYVKRAISALKPAGS